MICFTTRLLQIMKNDLSDVTFLIPIRIDSLYRLENIRIVVKFLQTNFDCRILIVEADRYNKGFIQKCLKNIDYLFIEDKDPIFYRTNYLNRMASLAQTPYLAIWDTDVFMPCSQIMDSLNKLRSGDFQFAYPYDGQFVEIPFILREQFLKDENYDFLLHQQSKCSSIQNSVGGAFFVEKSSYIQAGMENTNFYGWGMEDIERFSRWTNLGYAIYRSPGALFHLAHPRNDNSVYISDYYKRKAWKELLFTQTNSKEELEAKVKNNYFTLNENTLL